MVVNYKKCTRLVLSGGGAKVYSMVGALHYIYEQGGLREIVEYWGTSAGSMVGLMLAIGYTPFEIFHEFFMTSNYDDIQQIDFHESIIEQSGICPIGLFGNKIRKYIEKKLGVGADPTFFDIWKQFNNKIHIIGTNTSTMQGECFDVDKTPLMKVIDAVEISCDLPYIFTKKVYNGNIYVDGGFINNYPINLADNGVDNVIGISISGMFSNIPDPTTDRISWLYRLIYIPILEMYRERVNRMSDKCIHIELNITNMSIIDISPTKKKKIEVFSEGYKQARANLQELSDLQKKFEYTETGEKEWD